MIALLSRFLSDDLAKLEQMKEAYESSKQGMEGYMYIIAQVRGQYRRIFG